MKAHYTCWDRPQAFAILNPDAEAIDDAAFLAVHSNRSLKLLPSGRARSRTASTGSGSDIAPDEFLRQFLDESREHVQAVVVGSAGTGKSHLIHWMRLHIPEQDDRIVVNIPRSGTSLRGILQSLISRLPETEGAKYTARLSESGNDSDPKPVRLQRLTVNIGLALRATAPQVDDEIEDYLLPDRLSMLFMDPYLQPRLAREGGVIEALTEHIGVRHEYSRQESVPNFGPADFAVVGAETDKLAHPTREVVATLLGDRAVLEVATRLVNNSIPRAISSVLNFTGDQLIELLTEVRREVARSGKEIILLIEDFARVHGLDQAMLEALLVPRSSATPDLARLRWAMAVTRGFYDQRVPEAVQQRMSFEIDMDETAIRRDADRHEEVAQFAARYLNAVRIRPTELQAWRLAGAAEADLPNPCDACAFKRECHLGFGEVNGVGLYPLNRDAVFRMLSRKDPDFPDAFNPRSLVGPVLQEVLAERYQEFGREEFPTTGFRDRMGGLQLRPADAEEVRKKAPVGMADRHITIVGLWGDQRQHAPDIVLRAFGLSPIEEPTMRAQETETERKKREEEVRLHERGDQPPPDPVLAAIEAWGNGEKMPEAIGRQVRGYVFDALTAAIEWDAVGLERSYFARSGNSPYFGERDIWFLNQQVDPVHGTIHLQIPSSGDPSVVANASMALLAIASLRRKGQLPQEPNPRVYYLQMARHLALWGSQVTDALQRVASPLGPERANAQARFLLLASVLSGSHPHHGSASAWVDSAFRDPATDFTPPPGVWRATIESLAQSRAAVVDAYLATGAAMKGGGAEGTIDGRALLAELASLERTGWRSDPANLPKLGADGPLGKVMQDLRRLAVAASDIADEEWQRQRSWLASVAEVLPGDTPASELKPVVRRLKSELSASPVAYDAGAMEALLRALDELDSDALDRARVEVRALAEGKVDPGLPALVVKERVRAITAWRNVDIALRRVLREVAAAADALDRNLDVERQAQVDTANVRTRLGTILKALRSMEA